MHYISTIYNKVITARHSKFAVLLASLSVALTFPFAAAAPVGAFDCVGNVVCLWQNSNYGGTKVSFVINYVPGCYNLTTNSNQVSSVVNNTYSHIAYYDEQWCGAGNYLLDNPTSHRANLDYDAWTNNWYDANDQISSFYVY